MLSDIDRDIMKIREKVIAQIESSVHLNGELDLSKNMIEVTDPKRGYTFMVTEIVFDHQGEISVKGDFEGTEFTYSLRDVEEFPIEALQEIYNALLGPDSKTKLM